MYWVVWIAMIAMAHTPLKNESDPNACYYDSDRDGYGDDLQSSMPLVHLKIGFRNEHDDNRQMISPSKITKSAQMVLIMTVIQQRQILRG